MSWPGVTCRWISLAASTSSSSSISSTAASAAIMAASASAVTFVCSSPCFCAFGIGRTPPVNRIWSGGGSSAYLSLIASESRSSWTPEEEGSPPSGLCATRTQERETGIAQARCLPLLPPPPPQMRRRGAPAASLLEAERRRSGRPRPAARWRWQQLGPKPAGAGRPAWSAGVPVSAPAVRVKIQRLRAHAQARAGPQARRSASEVAHARHATPRHARQPGSRPAGSSRGGLPTSATRRDTLHGERRNLDIPGWLPPKTEKGK